jgi:hypothetical protein
MTFYSLKVCLLIILFVYRGFVRMAEGEGFEPPLPLRANMISSHAHSTGLCHPSVQVCKSGNKLGNRPRKVKAGLRDVFFQGVQLYH